MNRLHPEKWLTGPHPVANTQLAPNETLAMAMMFDVISGTDITHCLFTVIRKGSASIVRNIIIHSEPDGFCSGHADDMAEYAAHEEKDLIQETKEQVMQFATLLLAEKDPNMTIDMKKPIYFIQTPSYATNMQTANHMMLDTEPEGDMPKKIIIKVLGLAENTNTPLKPESPAEEQIEPVANQPKQTLDSILPSKEEKAEVEARLIKKFGKKRMEGLAERMGYKGEILNKTNKLN